MIPVGTICLVVGPGKVVDSDGRIVPVPSRICTVTQVPGPGCHCADCAHVCRVQFQDGANGCCHTWNCLRPITPPEASDSTTHDEPIAEVA